MKNAVVFVIDSLGDGGAEKVILALAKGFYDRGYQAHVITIKNHVVYDIPHGVIYHTMNFKKGLGIYRMLTDLRLKQQLIKAIDRISCQSKVRVLFSHLMFSDTILSGCRFEFPVVFTVHNNYTQLFLKTKKGISRAFKRLKLKKIYDGRHIVCVSDGVKQDLLTGIGVSPASITTVYNPFPIGEIRKKAEQTKDIRHDNYILHVGRFSPQKRHDILLKAFSRSGLDCDLILLGSGTQERANAIKELAASLNIADRLIMPGFVKNPYAWMKKARLMVLSSDFEGFGLVLIESVISGTPAISTDCPSGPRELLGSQPELLSPPGDIDTLAKNMNFFYHHPPAIDENHIQKFSVDTIVSQLEDQVNRLI